MRVALSPYQRDIWIAESQTPGSPQFNGVLSERFEGDLDVGLLRECFARALARHDAFRLRVDEEDGVPFQRLADSPDEMRQGAVETVDFSREPDPEAACRAWRENATSRPFMLRNSKLFKAALLVESGTILYIFLKVHHLILDGRAVDILYTEVLEDYVSLSRGQEPRRRKAAPSVLATATSRDPYFASPECDADRSFFRDEIAKMSPSYFARRAEPGSRPFGLHTFTIPGSLLERIKERRSTPFSCAAAAVGTWLARFHGTRQAVIGVPLLNRRTRDELTAVAQYANTLPLRIEVPSHQSMLDIAAAVDGSVKNLQKHQRLPIGEVLRQLPTDGNQDRRLFDVTLSLMSVRHPAVLEGVDREGPTFFAPPHDHEVLSVSMVSTRGRPDLRVDLRYATDVFDADLSITSFAEHLLALLHSGLDDDLALPAAELPMLSERELRTLHRYSRGAEAEYAHDKTVHELIAQRAALVPSRSAVLDARGRPLLTYAELDNRSDKLATALSARGVGPGDKVAVLMERSTHMLVAILGVLKAGGAYVPIDTGYPERRIAFCLDDCAAKVVIVDSRSTEAPTSTGAQICSLGELLQDHEGLGGGAADGDDLAYVIYTSGSTGRPKGVMVEHRSVVNRLSWMQREFPIGANDVVLQKTPISFDVSVWELFWWAIEGASVAMLPPGGEKDPREIIRAVGEAGVSVLHFVPSMLAPFLDLLEEFPKLLVDVASLRYVFSSGEALPARRLAQFNRVFNAGSGSGPILINLYGPTEATVDVSVYRCPTGMIGLPLRVPIGRPIDNIQLNVVDSAGIPQPIGVPGELWVSGVGVARGYLNRPEMTREKFLDAPPVSGCRTYRTGDLARWLSDGTLEYLGRLDGQVKIRGNRVELGEVQDAVARIPGISDAVVIDHHVEDRGPVLVAYYTTDDGQACDATELRSRLALQLPDFMLPAHFEHVDALPLAPNGKLDRRRLPTPGRQLREHRQRGKVRPGIEDALAAIWAEVLELPDVDIHDDYYALGGDSLQMLRVRALAERRGIHFSLQDLVWHPTVAGLAARASSQAEPEAHDAAPDLTPFALISDTDRARLEGATDAFPLNRLQLGLVFHSLREEHSAVYHDVFRYRLAMRWDEERFRRAFERLVARHPALRSSFDFGGFSEPLQIVHPEVDGGVQVIDLRDQDPDDGEALIREHIEERRFHQYDFKAAPLYLFRVHVRDGHVDLVLSFHHALLDGGSVANLLRELFQDYLHSLGAAIPAVSDTALPSPAHHVRLERLALEQPAAREHWNSVVSGAETVRLENRAATGTTHTADQVVQLVTFPDDLSAQLGEVARRHALPVKSVLLAAHCLTMQLHSGLADFTTGLISHGRPEQAGGERMAGLFLNTVPVRIRPKTSLGTAESWIGVARELFLQERAGRPHQRYPLSAMQKDAGGGAFLHTAFNYVHFRVLDDVVRLPELGLQDFQTWEETDFQLLVNAFTDPANGGVGLRLDCDGRAITELQAEQFGRTYTAILRRIVTVPEERPDAAFLATAPSRKATSAPAGEAVTVLFDRQVGRTPDAPAVADDSRTWTYSQLRSAADDVARQLLALGAPPGARIGVAMDRTHEAIATILGIAKAGAACVPLDTGYPQARLAAMIKKTQPFTIIADDSAADVVADPAQLLPSKVLFSGRSAVVDGAASLPSAPRPDTTAYILFTSGSTGRPKGVVMPHRSLANLIGWQARAASAAQGRTTAQCAPLSFDVSFQEIYSTLCTGGLLRLVPEQDRRDIRALLRRLDRDGVERVFLPYVLLQQLAEASVSLGSTPAKLRVIVSSGEQLRVTDDIRAFLAALPGAILENQYGPTESHVVTSHTMSGDPAGFPSLPPIGIPIDGAEVHVLDEAGYLAPTGVTGEVHLGGVPLADGYLDDPALTAEHFVRRATTSGEVTLYRTGDLARTLPDGSLSYAGRVDMQVKIRGHRVEPAETELAITHLAAHEPYLVIREVAVVARTGPDGQLGLTAFLVGDAERTDTAKLMGELRATLPEFMIPTHVEWLERTPLTPSGKRDDQALRTRPLAQSTRHAGILARDTIERTLADLVAEVLGTAGVGVDDDLFARGLTSLTAMRLAVLIEQRFGVAVPISRMIMHPTVGALAGLLRADGAAPAFDPLVTIRGGGSKPPLFLVHPMGGNVICYLPLAKHLPHDQPLYAFHAAGADPGTQPLRTIADIAAAYITAMRGNQPDGPYHIGGWSFGGFVAFEMTRQLRAAGQEVKTILLDTVALGPTTQRRTFTDEALLGWFFWELLLVGRGGSSPVESMPEGCTDIDDKFEYIARAAVNDGILPAGSTGGFVHRLFEVYAANWYAAKDFRPDADTFDITLIRALEPLPDVLIDMHGVGATQHVDPANGWHTMTHGRVEVIHVPGNHLTIMEEPHVARVAQAVASLLPPSRATSAATVMPAAEGR